MNRRLELIRLIWKAIGTRSEMIHVLGWDLGVLFRSFQDDLTEYSKKHQHLSMDAGEIQLSLHLRANQPKLHFLKQYRN